MKGSETAYRRLPLKSASNVRDLGGYCTAGGGTTRWRAFLRADAPNELDREDVRLLMGYGLATAIDLRTEEEQARQPSAFAREGGVRFLSCPLVTDSFLDDVVGQGHFDRLYEVIAEHGKAGIAKAFHAFASEAPCVLFNCTAGKDRTGVLAALLLDLAGVPREDVLADYMTSYVFNRVRLGGLPKGASKEEPWWRALNSDFENIERFFEQVEGGYGGTRAYLRAIGLGDGEIEAILRKFVQGGGEGA
jgi:protein-tyrosine phosphatase